MKRSAWRRCMPAGIVVGICLCVMVRPGEAAEEARKFLDALRELGYYDAALDYLEQARTDPLVGSDFKQVIDYEAGVTLITGSRAVRVMSAREKQLDEARERLNKFLTEHPTHRLSAGANTQLANLLVERGRIKAEQAASAKRSADEKKQLTEQSRKLYLDAQKVFEQLEKQFLEAHRKFPKFIEKTETKKIEQRDQVRRDLLQARLALATVLYELAQTYEPGSKGQKENLTAAAKRYNELYEKYGARLAGLYARMWEGRCYKELGEPAKAFECFEELLSQPDEPQAFRTLKNKATVLALETALLPKVKKYKQAVNLYNAWEKTARGQEESSDEGLAIKYLSGEAAFEYAQTLTKKEGVKQRDEFLKHARGLFNDVARFEGDYQKKAKVALVRPEFVGKDFELPEPTTFAEARDRGKDALDRMQATGLKSEELAEQRAEAIRYYRMAMGMRTPEVTAEEMNVIRYYLAYLYWMSGDLYEAAVCGEFLARRYPGGMGARQGAKIAMAAYAKMLGEISPGGDNTFETDRMVGIAQYIAGRWDGEADADEAWRMLIRNAVVNRQLGKAREYLQKISTDSPRRGQAELMTGQAMWGAYLKASRLPEGERPSQEQLDKMVEQTQNTLEQGIARMRKPVDEGAEVSYTLVASVLSLGQIFIGAGEPAAAVKWLDDPKIGAMTLVRAKHPVTDRGNFRVETYKAALRAYVAKRELDKAEKTMKALEELVREGGDAGAGKKLTQIYIKLGRELEELLVRLRDQKKTEQLAEVSRGFEMFLDQISKRKQGNNFSSLNWVAETFAGMGAGFDPGGTTLPAEAKKYYSKAVDTYRTIIKRCEADDKEFAAPPGAATSIKIRLAKCLRRLGENKQAMRLLLDILEKRTTMVDAQVQAAYTYQAWGEQKPGYYLLAIKGSTRYKQVWGWGRIAKRVAGSEKHRSVFHEARYNLALCRLKLAQSKTGSEKTALLEQAQKDISVTQRLFPKMGGEEWFDKYDQLLKKIQKLRGVKAEGLKTANCGVKPRPLVAVLRIISSSPGDPRPMVAALQLRRVGACTHAFKEPRGRVGASTHPTTPEVAWVQAPTLQLQ